jgi:FixJ family two-component response regulator
MTVGAFLSGEAFLEWLPANRIDCVVLDLHMPGMSGFDVLTRMAAKGGKVPVIIITGHDSPEARDRAMASGATTYLAKPVDDEALLDALRAAIGGEGLP